MASVCKSAIGCIDAGVPIRATYVNLYKWPESDAEFVKSVVIGDEKNPRKWGPSPRVVDSYSCRQMYLRSYTFSKKESVPEKTRKCLGKVMERASELRFVAHQKRESSSSKSVERKNKKKRMKKKSCVRLKRLREASYTAFYSIFCRLLSCTISVEVVDRRLPS